MRRTSFLVGDGDVLAVI